MKRHIRTAVVYIITLAAALWLSSTFAQSGYEQTVRDACAAYGCDAGYVLSILNCESGGDPSAWHANPNGGADVGIMQINDATWGAIAYAGPEQQIWWAAQMIANGYGGIWSCG